MNHALIRNLVGKIILLVGLFMILPLAVAIIYYIQNLQGVVSAQKDTLRHIISFVIPIVLQVTIGILLNIKKSKEQKITAREGFIIVALSWFIMSLCGALPLIISGDFVYDGNYLNSFFDSFFEMSSGFTTTGASVCPDVEALSHSIQFWRTFSHWIGGMGILVFILAIIPESKEGSAVHILRAESPGPQVDKLVSRTRVTTRILYIIYIVLTIAEFLFLWLGKDEKMDLFNSLVYALGTAGTGGFSIDNVSPEGLVGLANYSNYSQYVIAVFMIIFSINFSLFYLILIGKIKDVIKNEEIKWFFGIVIISIAAFMLILKIYNIYSSFEELFRYSLFTTATIISTTGYGNVDFTTWPEIAKCLIMILTIIGGCAGSTAGGIKVTRLVILIKSSFNKLRQLINPRKVKVLNVDGKPMTDETVDSVQSYMILHFIIFIACALLISVDGSRISNYTLLDSFSASLTCISNVGPGITQLIGPAGGFIAFSNFSKFILSIEMIAGRLELFPVLILFSPKTWIKKY